MEKNFQNYKEIIKCLLPNAVIMKILREPLSRYFSFEVQQKIKNDSNLFFEEFEKIQDNQKYEDFITVTKDVSDWISRLLDTSIDNEQYKTKMKVAFALLHVQSEKAIESFPMNEVFLRKCCHRGILTELKKDELIALLMLQGHTAVKYHLFWEVHLRQENFLPTLLLLLHQEKTNFINEFFDDLQKMIDDCTSDDEVEQCINAYANSIIQMNIDVGQNIHDGIGYDNVKEFDGPGSKPIVPVLPRTLPPISLGSETDRQPIDRETLSMAIASATNNNGNIDRDAAKEESGEDDNSGVDNGANDDVMDDMFGALRDKEVDDILTFVPPKKVKKDDSANDLQMRQYQQELVNEGIQGRNVLICAPTGSGKTVVAVKIVQEHLQKNKTNGKVAFIVHRLALVEQQYNQFSKYLKFRITRLSGSAKSSSTPLIGHLPSFDIFVMTSDILRNALEQDNETKLKSIGVFTMILFDECHNCDKKHPYNRIMNHYFKSQSERLPVPQIIGLTASTGTNKANTMDKAMKRLFTLCANLDCNIVSTVKEHKLELQNNQSVPIEEIIAAPARSQDNFDTELQMQMEKCENFLQEMNKRDFFPKDSETQLIFNIPDDRLHQKYGNFVGKLERLQNNTKTENEGREAIYTITQYLNAFVRALMVNHLFRAEDAISVIHEFLHLSSSSTPICKVENSLRKNLAKLEKGGLMQTSNPCVQRLQEEVIKQLDKDNNSRIIVFVKERAYTQILKDMFTALNNVKIKCDMIVGNTISADKGGLTQNEMESVLERFRKGECNVLFSTTIAEEGLDVQECNLVIRYGHVTNETAMVQSRGRARAHKSKYLVIVPNKLQWQINKENINKYRESMMYKAIENFQSMDKNKREHEIQECIFERQLLADTNKISKISLKNCPETTRLFKCKKCNTEICTSRDIRVAEKAHHLVINTAVFDRMWVNTTNSQICCKNCSNPLGNRQNYKNRIFPNLTISYFTLVIEGQSASKTYKKWRDVDFEVLHVTNKELLDFSTRHSLSDL